MPGIELGDNVVILVFTKQSFLLSCEIENNKFWIFFHNSSNEFFSKRTEDQTDLTKNLIYQEIKQLSKLLNSSSLDVDPLNQPAVLTN